VGKVDKYKRLRELQNKLLGIELDLDLIEQDIENIDSDINYLILMEEETIYNINILKQDKIVADIKAYRLAWIKLVNIRTKISELRSKRSQLGIKLDNRVNAKDFYDREWDKMHREMEDEKVILLFKKESKRGGR
jgi:hypothetical protein